MDKFEPKLSWNSSRDDVINDFYKPALLNCELYQRLSGYFSSSTFANVANEILEFIDLKGKIQLITSPQLSEMDKQLFEQSVIDGEKLLSTIFLDDLKNDPDNIKLEFAKLMAYMLTNMIDKKPQLEIKIAIPTTGPGIYHQKIGILRYRNGQKIAFSGSVNETGMGWHENIENFTVFRSWGDDTNNQGVVDNQRDFNDLWNNNNDEVRIFDLPKAIQEHLLTIRPDSDKEFEETKKKIKEIIRNKRKSNIVPIIQHNAIELHHHQIVAIEKWITNDFCGLLEMATGTGKTFTAFGCMNEIQKTHERSIIIIACPQLHLVEQWKKEIENWNIGVADHEKIIKTTALTCNSDYHNWENDLEQIIYNFNNPLLGTNDYLTNHIVIFTTHKTATSDKFTQKILRIKNAKKLFVVDEVHNITAKSSQTILLDNYEYRLGLSATPVRHLDDEGTQILDNYFHGIVEKLNLKKAIHDLHVLCTYEYFPYYVQLTENEMEIHQDLTRKIAQIEIEKKRGMYKKKKGDFDPYLARSALIANAENKDNMLKEILDVEFNNNLEHTLIYCTNDLSLAVPRDFPKQLERVKNILTERGIISDSVTWEDEAKDRLHILDLMDKGHFDCVTAVKCLDEGIDVPSVKTGIFMASSGNPKQFIQRRGRILRKSERTGKTSASIYDILVTPPIPTGDSYSFNLSQRKLIAKELLRHKEFALISNNMDEAIKRIKTITTTFDIDFDALNYEYVKEMS